QGMQSLFPPRHPAHRFLAGLFVLVLTLLTSFAARAASVSVGDEAGLRTAITNAANGDLITLTSNIVLGADLPIVQASITIDGGGHQLVGSVSHRVFFIANFNGGSTPAAVNVTIQNITIGGAKAVGGAGGSGTSAGGGGGAGLGGAIFVADH